MQATILNFVAGETNGRSRLMSQPGVFTRLQSRSGRLIAIAAPSHITCGALLNDTGKAHEELLC